MEIRTEQLSDKVNILEGRNEDIREGNDIFMSDMFEKFEFSVCPLCEYGRREWLHDFLDCHARVCQLILCGTYEPKGAHSDGLKVDIARRHLEAALRDKEVSTKALI